MTKQSTQRSRIGPAHIGVIRALKDAGIYVDCVAGTSIGTVIGVVQHNDAKTGDMM